MAIKGQGAILSIGGSAAGSPATATGATTANPCVVTAANSFSNGNIIVASGFSGITQLNNRAFVASAVSGSVVTLKGEDATGYGSYVSGGLLQKQSMQAIGSVADVSGFDGQSSELDATNLQSAAKEFLLGLQDFGHVTLTLQQISDAGQTLLRAFKTNALVAAFSLQLSDGTIAAFMAFVKQYSFTGVKPDGLITNSVSLRVTNAPAWFA